MDYRIIDFIVVEIFAYDISYLYTLKYFDTAKVPKRKKKDFSVHIFQQVCTTKGVIKGQHFLLVTFTLC